MTERSPLPDLVDTPQTIVVTGVMAAGKSTVSQILAERFNGAVHLQGDEFRRVVVSGRVDMSPHGDQAGASLALRHRIAAHTANIYAEAGFTVVVQDLFVGASLEPFLAQLRDPVSIVMLAPDVSTVMQREAERTKTGYGPVVRSGLRPQGPDRDTQDRALARQLAADARRDRRRDHQATARGKDPLNGDAADHRPGRGAHGVATSALRYWKRSA